MHYLFDFAKARGRQDNAVFRAAGYPQRLAYPALCFSILRGGDSMPAPLFPPSADGWGIGAVPGSGGINLTITRWDNDPRDALSELASCLHRMNSVLATD